MAKSAFKRVNVRGIIRYEDTLLVVKHKEKHEHFFLPGGGVKKEESLIQSLERELEEELGIIPTIGNILFVNQFGRGPGKLHVLEIFFEIQNVDAYKQGGILSGSHAHEIYAQQWVQLSGNELILPHGIKEDLSAYDGTAQYMFVA